MFHAIVVLMVVTLCEAQVICSDKTCDGAPQESAPGTAMLQISSSSQDRSVARRQDEPTSQDMSKARALTAAKNMNFFMRLQKARVCLPDGLQDKYLELLRKNAKTLAVGGDITSALAVGGEISSERLEGGADAPVDAVGLLAKWPAGEIVELLRIKAAALAAGNQTSSKRSKGGADATLDAAGFKETTSMCCPEETELFFNRLVLSMSLQVCSKPHVQGLMHWFSCVPDMDFQYLVDIINNGNPCKYWALSSGTCPALSEKCQGEYCR
jgi:hypothetical protein